VALDDAKFLLDGTRSCQSIVNRSYYAMFYAALALLQKIGQVPSKHAGVISIFDTEFVLKGVFSRELSRDFHKAFEMRQVCDYRVFEPCSWEEAKEIWKKAVHFVEAVREHLRPELADWGEWDPLPGHRLD
jgi:uncharacterized protein (UPF0332 family)